MKYTEYLVFIGNNVEHCNNLEVATNRAKELSKNGTVEIYGKKATDDATIYLVETIKRS